MKGSDYLGRPGLASGYSTNNNDDWNKEIKKHVDDTRKWLCTESSIKWDIK